MIIELGRASTETKGIPTSTPTDPITVVPPKRIEFVEFDIL